MVTKKRKIRQKKTKKKLKTIPKKEKSKKGIKKNRILWRNPEFLSQLGSKLEVAKRNQQNIDSIEEASCKATAHTTQPSTSKCRLGRRDSTYSVKTQPVNHRHKALAILHNHIGSLQVRFQSDLVELEELYVKKYYKPLYELRKLLLEIQPQDVDYDERILESCKASFVPGSKNMAKLETCVNYMLSSSDERSGLPCKEFWLKVLLRASPIVRQMIHQSDVDILKYLRDIRTEPLVSKYGPPMSVTSHSDASTAESSLGFALRFEFFQNPYFSNGTLHKCYVVEIEPDQKDYVKMRHRDVIIGKDSECDADGEDSDGETTSTPSCSRKPKGIVDKLMDYTGPQVVSANGCCIKWMVFDARNRGHHAKKKSFFDFFETTNDKDPDNEKILARDYKIGLYFKDVLIPRAYLFFRRKSFKTKENIKSNRANDVIPLMSQGPKVSSERFRSDFKFATQSPSSVANKYDEVDDDIPFELSLQALNKLRYDEGVKNDVYRNNRMLEAGFSMSRMATGRRLPSTSTLPSTVVPALNSILPGNRGVNDVDEEVRVTPLVCDPSHEKREIDVDDVVVTGKGKVLPEPLPPFPNQNSSQTGMCPYRPVLQSPSRENMAKMIDHVNALLKRGNPGAPGVTQSYSVPMNAAAVSDAHKRMMEYEEDSEIPRSGHGNSMKGDDADDEFAWSDYIPAECQRKSYKRNLVDKVGAGILKRHPRNELNVSGSPSTSTASTKRSERHITFQDVSPYPSEGEVDESGAESTVENSFTESDDEIFAMRCTPSSSDTGEDVKDTMIGYEVKTPVLFKSNSSTKESLYGMKIPKPLPISVGGRRQLRNDDAKRFRRTKKYDDAYDSEAPPPAQDSACKQQ